MVNQNYTHRLGEGIAMTLDEKALEAAHQAWDRDIGDVMPSRISADMERNAIRGAIEAYEAARPDPNPWRPIEEAPRDGTKFLVWLKVDAYPKLHLLHWDAYDREFHDVTGMCWSEHGAIHHVAMFRTIDPPPQDDVSRATSTPPAAEASS